MSRLLGARQQLELKKLVKDPYIAFMAVDLRLLGVSSSDVRRDGRFGILNDKYQELSGKTCLRIGSVLDAVCLVMRDLEGELI
jgi:hypothetical protein